MIRIALDKPVPNFQAVFSVLKALKSYLQNKNLKASLLSAELHSVDVVVAPYLVNGNHWNGCCMFMPTRTFYWFDPYGSSSRSRDMLNE